jgi:hypothetical protein
VRATSATPPHSDATLAQSDLGGHGYWLFERRSGPFSSLFRSHHDACSTSRSFPPNTRRRRVLSRSNLPARGRHTALLGCWSPLALFPRATRRSASQLVCESRSWSQTRPSSVALSLLLPPPATHLAYIDSRLAVSFAYIIRSTIPKTPSSPIFSLDPSVSLKRQPCSVISSPSRPRLCARSGRFSSVSSRLKR